MGRIKITCDEATTICDKSQYNKASFTELIKLNLHFLGCKLCKMYSKQNTLLSRVLRKNKSLHSICKLSEEDKAKMRAELEKQNLK